MPWPDVLGHDAVFDQFRRSLRRGRLASTFLFVGVAGIGKRTVAHKIAQAMLCEKSAEDQLAACEHCSSCVQFTAGSHPDLLLVRKPDDKSFIPVELFIGDREHRMREGLCHDISLKPYHGGRKVAIIDDADFMNAEGANCLLKTLEEPPPKSVLILIGSSEQQQLPTIRSRCQIVRFQPLADEHIVRLLREQNVVPDDEAARQLAALAHGSLARAIELADEALREFRDQLFSQLSRNDFATNGFHKELSEFVDQAGKEAPPRRIRMKQIFGFAADFYQQLSRQLCGLPIIGDESLRKTIATTVRTWPSDAESAAACVDRCLDAQLHVEANANQTTLLECWLDDLASLRAGG